MILSGGGTVRGGKPTPAMHHEERRSVRSLAQPTRHVGQRAVAYAVRSARVLSIDTETADAWAASWRAEGPAAVRPGPWTPSLPPPRSGITSLSSPATSRTSMFWAFG